MRKDLGSLRCPNKTAVWNGAIIKEKSRISLPSKPSIHFARVIVRFDTFYHDSFRSSSLGIKKSNLGGGGGSSWPSKGRKIVGRRKKIEQKMSGKERGKNRNQVRMRVRSSPIEFLMRQPRQKGRRGLPIFPNTIFFISSSYFSLSFH